MLGMVAILLLVIPDIGLVSDDASFWVLAVIGIAVGSGFAPGMFFYSIKTAGPFLRASAHTE